MPIPGTRIGPKIISLTGDQGSGKSTVASELESRWGVKKYYTGAVLREIALKRGIDILAANHLATADPSIDREIDAVYKSLAQTPEDLIVDARLAWHFLPQSFKIKLTVCPDIAAERIFRDKIRKAEHVDSPPQIKASIMARSNSEIDRFKNTYGINIQDDSNYDLLIDTANVGAQQVADLIDRLSPRFFSGEHTEHRWISPRSMYPSIMPNVTDRGLELPPDEFDNVPITVVDMGRLYLIVDGHVRTSKAVMAGIPFIPVRSVKPDEVVPGRTLTGAEFYRQNLNLAAITEWQNVHGFNYLIMPEAV